MKKVILFLFVSLTTTSVFAQEKKAAELSNAEQFSERSGTLIQKVFVEIGTLKKCEIKLYLMDL